MVVADEQMRPVDELVNDALKRRPDINSQRIDLKNRDISKRATRNSLRPTVDLYGFYGGSSLTGVSNTNPSSPSLCVDPVTGRPCVQNGFGTALGDTFNGSYPDKGVAIQINIPILNPGPGRPGSVGDRISTG